MDEVIFLNHTRKIATERNESLPTVEEIMKLIVEAYTPLPDTVIVDIIAEYAVSPYRDYRIVIPSLRGEEPPLPYAIEWSYEI